MIVETCVICSEPIENITQKQKLGCQCTAAYHKDCIFKWLDHNSSCPTCRSPVIIVTRQKKQNEKATLIGLAGLLIMVLCTIAIIVVN
jgi:hypothetical protein